MKRDNPAAGWIYWICITIAFMCVCTTKCDLTHGSPPDPVFRMESPSGCSGGWIHASRKYGLWGATCKHCVSRAKSRVRVRLFQNGHKSPTVEGYCFASSRGHDASVIWIPPANYRHELPMTFQLSPTGPQAGETVFAIGSFAGGTVHPAARKLHVTRRGSYEFNLNDSAWGGHSGGAVVNERNQLVGVLWGAGRGYSAVTSSRAVWEIMYGTRPRRQAFASVNDDLKPVAMGIPTVKVYGTAAELAGFYRALQTDQQMQSITWQFEDSRLFPASRRPMFTWNDGRTNWQIDGWPGMANLAARFGAANKQVWSVQYCPNCPQPGRGGSGRQSPLNPWTVIPPAPGQQPDAGLQRTIQELKDAARTAKIATEDAMRKQRIEFEDRMRAIQSPGQQAPIPPTQPPQRQRPRDDRLDEIIRETEEGQRVADQRTRKLKDAGERIDQIAPVQEPGTKDWIWPGALLASVLVGGGAYARGKGKTGKPVDV